MSVRWAILGGLVGAGIVTGVGVFLSVRRLQSPAFQAETQAHAVVVAGAAASHHLEDAYGVTSARMAQFATIARRFRS